ncbi:MAG: hypothetical protein OEV42_17600 [Deltaproteobacteria bacterium]|nr:hypothetical protein [Deltaproteobacteria bacterium]
MFRKYLVVAVMVLLFPAGGFAGQVGGMADQMGGQLLTVTGYIGLIDRDIKMNPGGADNDFTSRVFAVKATYGLNNKVDLYVTLGLADLQDIAGFDGSLGTLAGGGVKVLIIEGANRTRLTFNGDVKRLVTDDTVGIDDVEADYREYSASLIISKKAGNLTPYGGVKLSKVDIDFDGWSTFKDAEEEKSTGLFAGVDYFVNPNVYFTGEIHVFAENTLYAGVGYNF